MCFMYDKTGPERYLANNKWRRAALCKFNHVSYEGSASFFGLSWWQFILQTFCIFIPECTASHISDNCRDNLKFYNSFHLSRFGRRRPRIFHQTNYKDDFS
jgi:hypothetical protein